MMQESLFNIDEPTTDEPTVETLAPEWLAMQKMTHDLVELINLTNAPRLGKVDRFLADKAALLANYIDRLIKPLEPK